MQNKERRRYPAVVFNEGTRQTTFCSDLYHSNTIAPTRIKDALRMADELYHSYEDDAQRLGAIMMMLSDVPEEPLLTANKANVASVLGLCGLGFMVNHKEFGPKARRIASSGDGQMILRITGDISDPQYVIELFDTQDEYAAFLDPILKSGDFMSVRGSTLL